MKYTPFKGVVPNDVWDYFNEIEKLNLGFEAAHTDVEELMEKLINTKGGARNLVERYSNSRSTYIFGNVGGALSHYARIVTSESKPDQASLAEIAELAFRLLQDVRWIIATPNCLLGILSSIHQITFSGYWETRNFPTYFYTILQRCLQFSWEKEANLEMLPFAALEILNAACKVNLKTLTNSFDKIQIEWLKQKAHQLSQLDQNGKAGVRKEAIELLQWLERVTG